MSEFLERLRFYALASVIPLAGSVAVTLVRSAFPAGAGSAERVTVAAHLQRLQNLSAKERQALLFSFAASPGWKVTRVPEYMRGIEGFQISRREQRDGLWQLPENVVHHGKENPPQTFLDIILAPNTNAPLHGRMEEESPLSVDSVTVFLRPPHVGDSRFSSRIALTGSGIRVTVDERSNDRVRSGTQEALEALARVTDAALGGTKLPPSEESIEPARAGCVAREEEWGSRFSVRGSLQIEEPGFVFVEAAGKLSGSPVAGITSDRELVGGRGTAVMPEGAYYYDLNAMLHPFRSSDHLLKLKFEPFNGGEIREIGVCTVESRR